jgi:hypothetical protein
MCINQELFTKHLFPRALARIAHSKKEITTPRPVLSTLRISRQTQSSRRSLIRGTWIPSVEPVTRVQRAFAIHTPPQSTVLIATLFTQHLLTFSQTALTIPILTAPYSHIPSQTSYTVPLATPRIAVLETSYTILRHTLNNASKYLSFSHRLPQLNQRKRGHQTRSDCVYTKLKKLRNSYEALSS